MGSVTFLFSKENEKSIKKEFEKEKKRERELGKEREKEMKKIVKEKEKEKGKEKKKDKDKDKDKGKEEEKVLVKEQGPEDTLSSAKEELMHAMKKAKPSTKLTQKLVEAGKCGGVESVCPLSI